MIDVFISHASEDKDEVARPIAAALHARGFDVWFDEYSLRLGDSLRDAIDRGLAQCRYGVVVLSPSFFAKSWTQKELDGLIARETGERAKRILPVWHNLTAEQVAAVSPTLAGRFAINTAAGINRVIDTIARELTAPSAPKPAAMDSLPNVPTATRGSVNVPAGFERRLNAIRFDVVSGRDPKTGKPVRPDILLSTAQQAEITAGRAVLMAEFRPARHFGDGMIVPRLRIWNLGKQEASVLSLRVNGDPLEDNNSLLQHGSLPPKIEAGSCVELVLRSAMVRELMYLAVETTWENPDGSEGRSESDFEIQPF